MLFLSGVGFYLSCPQHMILRWRSHRLGPLDSVTPARYDQDVVAGDGTTSVVVLCGALLKKALELLERGVHPTLISDAFNLAVTKAVEVCWPPRRPSAPLDGTEGARCRRGHCSTCTALVICIAMI